MDMTQIAEADDRRYAEELESTIRCFEELSRIAEGEVETPEEFFWAAEKHLSADAFAHILMQVVGDESDTRGLTTVQKNFALVAAEILGPDHAQALYRFAVLVTKLA